VGVYAFLFLKDRDLEVIHRRERKKKTPFRSQNPSHYFDSSLHFNPFFPPFVFISYFSPIFSGSCFFFSFFHSFFFFSFIFFLFSFLYEKGKWKKKKTKDERKNLAKL